MSCMGKQLQGLSLYSLHAHSLHCKRHIKAECHTNQHTDDCIHMFLSLYMLVSLWRQHCDWVS